MRRVLVLGGYGNFGKRICLALCKDNIPIVITGRNDKKAKALKTKILVKHPNSDIEIEIFDAQTELDEALAKTNPHILINTVGPFQSASYDIAKTSIKHGVHYIDLADAREFVINFKTLNNDAIKQNILAISGASTVPALSSAVIDYFLPEFKNIDTLEFGIASGQKSERGLATTKAILSYIGRPILLAKQKQKPIYGWQDTHLQPYPILGKRWMANCDIPDLDLFPEYYKLKDVKFSAGMETSILHFGIWLCSWIVRLGIPIKFEKHAKFLLKLSHVFDFIGTNDGGMHIILKGQGRDNQPKRISWFIIAKNGHGPEIPAIPAIILAKKLYNDQIITRGAMPCVSMINLDEYLAELDVYDIETVIQHH